MNDRSTAVVAMVIVLLSLGFLLVSSMFGMFAWGPMMMGRGMMGGWGHWAGPGWGFALAGMFIPLLFLVLLLVGVYLLLTSRGGSAKHERAMEILNERYAKGEITKEQYADMKKQLAEK